MFIWAIPTRMDAMLHGLPASILEGQAIPYSASASALRQPDSPGYGQSAIAALLSILIAVGLYKYFVCISR